VNGPIVLVFGK